MSYSFSLRAPTKADLLTAADAEFDKIVAAQPIHSADREAAIVNITAAAALVAPRDGHDYSLSANGYVSSDGNGLLAASISASVHLVRAE